MLHFFATQSLKLRIPGRFFPKVTLKHFHPTLPLFDMVAQAFILNERHASQTRSSSSRLGLCTSQL